MSAAQPLITIILPLYNVWTYLDVAIASVKAQTYPHFECLCLNDGSTNEMLEKAKALTADDPRFHVYDFPNAGVAATRNRGLDLAQGDFITFLDQDDYYHPGFLEEMLRLITANDADCAICTYHELTTVEEQQRFVTSPLPTECTETLITDPLHWILRGKSCFFAVWIKLWRVSALKGRRLNPAIFGADDMLFTCENFVHFKRIIHTTAQLYGYRMHPDNVTSHNPSRYAISKCFACEVLIPSIPPRWKRDLNWFILKQLSAVVKDYRSAPYPAEEHRAILHTIDRTLKAARLSPLRWSLKKYLRYRKYHKQWCN